MIVLDLSILNQKGTPMFYSDTFVNRPAFGIVGRIFISIDTKEIFRDTGIAWELVSDANAGSSNLQQVTDNGSTTTNAITAGGYTATNLAGGGSQMLVVDNAGVFGVQAIPTSTNIYNSDGTLTAARTVTLGGNNLVFEGGASVARLRLSANNNVARIFSFATANVARWAFRVDGNETGANAGADFAIRRYNDAGTIIDAPISINRATGALTFANLAGSGTQMVVTDNNGLISKQAIPSGAAIGNVVTGGTQGSVLFIGAAGVLQQDNANFFWDDANNRFGLLTNAPAYTFDLPTNSTTLPQYRVGSFNIQSYGLNNVNLSDNIYFNNTNWSRVQNGFGFGLIFFNGQVLLHGVANGSGTFANNLKFKFDYEGAFVIGNNLQGAQGNYTGATALFTKNGRLLLGTTIEGTNILDVVGGTSSFTMPSAASIGLVIKNYDGNADWQFRNNGNNPTSSRICIQVPRWATGTAIQITDSVQSNTATHAIHIGGGVSAGYALSNYSIRLGFSGNSGIGSSSIAIGTLAIASGANSTCIQSFGGTNGIQVLNDQCFALNSQFEGATTQTGQGVLGATNIFIGRPPRSTSLGNQADGLATSLNGMGGYGKTNATGGNLTIAGGVGLGSGIPGDIIFATATAGVSGTTVQTLSDRGRFKAGTGQLILNNYTTTTSFTGTLVGLLGFDSSGNVLTIAPEVASQSGQTGKFLTTDGTNTSWATISGGNIYNTDGTLTGNRVVTLGLNNLTFDGSAGGDIILADATHIQLGSVTGTKFGTTTAEKLAFYGLNPVAQQTTSVSAGAFVQNSTNAVYQDSTFSGYTIGQIVEALRFLGLLA